MSDKVVRELSEEGKHILTHWVGWRLPLALQRHLLFCNITKLGLTSIERGEERMKKGRRRRKGGEEDRRKEQIEGEKDRRKKRKQTRRSEKRGIEEGKGFHLGRNAISVACPTTLPIHQLSLYVCRDQSEQEKSFCVQVFT